ncbi:uncharacterized protein LOC111365597 [Olea europaea var. sylvestris]|uniref:uncharacterized protein LOC111365597 n=1 Tax=Olea europaea var. sylvestris TaxID=158386 RepID=UPI000C1D4ACF|nr:uncharacterized protein LOC111365597 [Olea europaea var. sylvestris]
MGPSNKYIGIGFVSMESHHPYITNWLNRGSQNCNHETMDRFKSSSGSMAMHTKWIYLHHCGKGRNARGIIPARHRGGGHKRVYRKIDFQWNEKDIYGRIVATAYNPNRNAYICLIYYGDVKKRYILHPKGAIIGDTIISGAEFPIKMGNALSLIVV